jgi:hypothetical protein
LVGTPEASPAAPPAAPTGGSNEATTTVSWIRSSTDPTVTAVGSAAAGAASVNPAGSIVLLPSGSTTSSSTAPCRRIRPNTGNDRPWSGCRGLVTVTDGGRSSIPVVRRVVLRLFGS